MYVPSLVFTYAGSGISITHPTARAELRRIEEPSVPARRRIRTTSSQFRGLRAWAKRKTRGLVTPRKITKDPEPRAGFYLFRPAVHETPTPEGVPHPAIAAGSVRRLTARQACQKDRKTAAGANATRMCRRAFFMSARCLSDPSDR